MGSGRAAFRDREFLALAGTAFARSQAYSTILIALALYADKFQTTGVVEGLFGTSLALVQLLIVLPLGRVIDTHDAKRLLLVGLALNVAVFAGFAVVSGPVDVILVRALQGLSASVLWLTGTAVVGELSPEGGRGRWLGAYNQVGAFSSLAGDLVGGYLLFAHGFRLTYLVLSLVTIGAFLLVGAELRENPGGSPGPAAVSTGLGTLRTLLDRPVVWSLVVFRVAFSVGKMAVIIFLPIYARTGFGISAVGIGAILAGGKLTKSLLQGRMGDLTDRIGGEHRFVAVGAVLYAVGTALIPLAGPVAAVVPSVSLVALGGGVTIPAAGLVLFAAYGVLGVADSVRLPASMALFVEEGEQFDAVGASLSLRSISWKVGQVGGPLLVGLVKDAVSVTAAFLTAAAFILVATGLFLATYRREPVDAPDRAANRQQSS